MSMNAEQIAKEALKLSELERARLADQLYRSIEASESWKKAWKDELSRRIKDHEEGRTKSYTREEAMALILERSRERRANSAAQD